MSPKSATATLRRAWAADLTTEQLYAFLRLRADVFVVEQRGIYQDLDGRDLLHSTRHFWIESESGAPVAYLRLLEEPGGGFRIGRMVTAASARRRGLARRLLLAALAEVGGAPCELGAQIYAVPLYASVGFQTVGEEYLEDGTSHIAMRRPAAR